MKNKKELGQNWLKNREILDYIAGEASEGIDVGVCLEIGPGLGFLTSSLLRIFERVVAVEFDEELARKLPNSFPGKSLEVVNADFLDFSLTNIEKDYVIAGNIPYYITSPIIRKILTAENKPKRAVLLVQKEVAERVVAGARIMEGDLGSDDIESNFRDGGVGVGSAGVLSEKTGVGRYKGQRSFLAIFVQNYALVDLGAVVLRDEFTPPPKVDSQVLVLNLREKPLISEKALELARVGFSNPRKKLVANLAAGIGVGKDEIREILTKIGVDVDVRPADLEVLDWGKLYEELKGAGKLKGEGGLKLKVI